MLSVASGVHLSYNAHLSDNAHLPYNAHLSYILSYETNLHSLQSIGAWQGKHRLKRAPHGVRVRRGTVTVDNIIGGRRRASGVIECHSEHPPSFECQASLASGDAVEALRHTGEAQKMLKKLKGAKMRPKCGWDA